MGLNFGKSSNRTPKGIFTFGSITIQAAGFQIQIYYLSVIAKRERQAQRSARSCGARRFLQRLMHQ